MPIPVSRRLDITEIPVIDVGRLAAGEDDPQAIAALGTACTDIGFIYVANHGVPPRVVAELAQQAARFFAHPMDEKRSISVDERMRGYLPLGYQSLVGQPGGGVSHQEGFWIGYDRPFDPVNPLDGPNRWLASEPELVPAMTAYFAAVERLSNVLRRAFALALGCPRDFFDPLFTAPQSLLKLNHYPPQDAPEHEGDIGVVGHCDTGGFTILWQDDNGGLEVQTKSGDWVGATPIRDTFVINLGNVMQTWTNGRFSSTPHRVINRSGTDRYSIPLFVNPSFDAPVKPLVGEPNDEPAERYADYQRDVYRRIFPVAFAPA